MSWGELYQSQGQHSFVAFDATYYEHHQRGSRLLAEAIQRHLLERKR